MCGPTPSLPLASSAHVCHASGRSSKESEAFSRPTRRARRQRWRSRRIVQNSRRIHTGPWTERKLARIMAQKLRLFRQTTGPKIKLGSILRAAMCRKMGWNQQLLLHMLLAWLGMSISRRPILDNSIPSCGGARSKMTLHRSHWFASRGCLLSPRNERPFPSRPCNSRWPFSYLDSLSDAYIYTADQERGTLTDSSRPGGEDGFVKGRMGLGCIKCFYTLCWEILYITKLSRYNRYLLSEDLLFTSHLALEQA